MARHVKRHARIAIRGPLGILVVAPKKHHSFNLVGGKASKAEDLRSAAIRERNEEIGKGARTTKLEPHSIHYSFKSGYGKRQRELHRVYSAMLKKGSPKPRHEIKVLKWVNRKNLGRTKLAFPANWVVPKLLGRRPK